MQSAIDDLSPDAEVHAGVPEASVLIIACGALARELVSVIRASGFRHIAVTCLPAELHNRPERIAPAVRDRIRRSKGRYRQIFCLYGDCGTGGELDRLLAEERVERIQGPHCYAFLSSTDSFDELMREEVGTFFLTDYLVRHFEKLVVSGLGLDRHPELLPMYFGHYRRVVYLAQVPDETLMAKARAAAARLGLDFDFRFTGLGPLSRFVHRVAAAPGEFV